MEDITFYIAKNKTHNKYYTSKYGPANNLCNSPQLFKSRHYLIEALRKCEGRRKTNDEWIIVKYESRAVDVYRQLK